MPHLRLRPRPPRPWRRPRTPAGRRLAALAALLVAALVLAACQRDLAAAPVAAWTEADLAAVFDLAELGRDLSAAPDGEGLLLDGKLLSADLLARFPHLSMGRTHNLLRLGDDTLAAMAPDVAAFLVRAAPGELRARLAEHGLTPGDVRAAWNGAGVLDLAAVRAVAARLDAAGGRVAASGRGPGARLLADLGVAW